MLLWDECASSKNNLYVEDSTSGTSGFQLYLKTGFEEVIKLRGGH